MRNYFYAHIVHSYYLLFVTTNANTYIKTLNYITNGSGWICTTELLNCICSHYHILSTAQILSYNDLMFYVILKIVIFSNFNKNIIKAPWRWCRSTETCKSVCNITWCYPLKTKRRLLYLKTQSVPRFKHFSSRL